MVAIREVETTCANHAYTLQQFLGESMQELEHEAIEKEGQDHQSFLDACGVALQTVPLKPMGYSYPLQLVTGNMSLDGLLETTPNQPLQSGNLPPQHHSNHVRDTHTSNGDQTMRPFVHPGGSLSKIRGGRSHSVRHDSRGAAPPKMERWEASGKTPEK